jgi:hypothetical protein
MTTSYKQQTNQFFIEYKYENFIRIQGLIPTTTLATTMHTNMFTHGSLKMWHIASFEFFKFFCQFFFNHPIQTSKLCHMAT